MTTSSSSSFRTRRRLMMVTATATTATTTTTTTRRRRTGRLLHHHHHHHHLPLPLPLPLLQLVVFLLLLLLVVLLPLSIIPPPLSSSPTPPCLSSSSSSSLSLVLPTPASTAPSGVVLVVEALSMSSPATTPPHSSSKTSNKKGNNKKGKNVLVVGGSGRVGGSTVSWLETFSERRRTRKDGYNDDDDNDHIDDDQLSLSFLMDDDEEDLNLFVGGRHKSSFVKAQQKQKLFSSNVEFLQLDLEKDNDSVLASKLQGMNIDLVVHTAGPFQGRRDPNLLRVCLESKIPYVDVCDEYDLAVKAKQQELFAKKCQVPAVVCGGIWPGISSLMAMDAVDKLLKEAEEEEQEEEEEAEIERSIDVDVEYSFFTAGTGNAGPTIVSATFLLLATPVLTFVNSKPTKVEPWTSPRTVDFTGTGTGTGTGNGNNAVGKKPVWLLDNPDVPTTATALLSTSSNKSYSNNNHKMNIKNVNVTSRFGTDPLMWNYLFGGIKTLIPLSWLQNQQLMQTFALFSEPIIRLVDKFVGATNAMRVDVTITTTTTTTTTTKTTDTNQNNQKKKKTSLIVHPDLERCVGLATAAFAVEVLKSSLQSKSKSQSSSNSNSNDDDNGDLSTTTVVIPPGVWYPAEVPSGVRRNLLQAAKEEAITYEV